MSMQNPTTLNEFRNKLGTEHAMIFHSSLALYILAEKRPKPGAPDWVEVGCVNRNGAEGMMVYLSPLDALLDARSRNSGGAKFNVYPFEAIDPRPYIVNHGNWLTLYLVYGFAGRGKRLLVGRSANIQAMLLGIHFQITPDSIAHFHLSFSDKLIDYLNTIHRAAGITDYARVIKDQAESSVHELGKQAREARLNIGRPIVGESDITHCALYDPIERQWRFAAFADLQDQEFAD